MLISEIELKNLIKKSIEQNTTNKEYYEKQNNENMVNFYLGKINALSSVFYYFLNTGEE
jgi:hypothetical protein